MTRLEPLTKEHYTRLLEINRAAEPHVLMDAVTFTNLLEKREGFVVVTGSGEVVGAITFSDFTGRDIIMHIGVHPDWQRRWLTRDIMRQGFDFVFVELDLPRCSAFSIDGITDRNDPLLLRAGFRHEGTIRNSLFIGGRDRDVRLYGMLREERKY